MHQIEGYITFFRAEKDSAQNNIFIALQKIPSPAPPPFVLVKLTLYIYIIPFK